MQKIVMQLLADSLGLSRVTIWKVLNNRPGVASATAQRVRDAVDRLKAENEEEGSGKSELQFQQKIGSITLLAARTDTSSFWRRIVDQIVSELNLRTIRLNYLPIDIMRLSAADVCAQVQPDKTDGVIVINVYDRSLLSTLAAVPTPKVFLDTVPGMTAVDLAGDLFLLEGERTVDAITDCLIRRGYRRIGFIGDIQYARTNALRWLGFQEGMARNGLAAEPGLCLTKAIGRDDYRAEIAAFLDGIPKIPEAFVCASDFVAFVALNLLGERGLRVPENVMLSGYDDTKEFLLEHHRVITAHVQNGLLGKQIIRQLLYRIENPVSDFEEIQIFPKILYRDN